MKTAIIYRSNSALDKSLSALRTIVDLFHVFPASSPVDSDAVQKLLQCKPISFARGGCVLEYTSPFDRLICDLTCLPHMNQAKPKNLEITVIGQQHGLAEEYIAQIAMQAKKEGMTVVLFIDCLADHIEVDGIDPYKISSEDRRIGWYYQKVLNLWITTFKKFNVAYLIGTHTDELSWEKTVVICDHHNRRHYDKLCYIKERHPEFIFMDAYCSNQRNKYSTLSEIPILFKA